MPWQSLTYHIKGDTGSIHTGKFRAGDSSVPITRGLWWDSFIWTEQHFKKYHQTTEITSVIIKCVNIRTKDLISLQISFPYFFPSLSMHPCLPSSHSSFHLTFCLIPILPFFQHFIRSSAVHCFISSLHPSTLRYSIYPIFWELTTHQLIVAPWTVWNTVAHLRHVHTGAVVTREAAWTRRYQYRA